jgi:hypothetical protein
MSDNFITGKIIEIAENLAKLQVNVNGFIESQNTVQGEIGKIHEEVAAIKKDVAGIKAEKARQRAYFAGMSTVLVTMWGTFQYFIWPSIKEKLGF